MPRKSGIGTGDYQIAELSVGLELDLEQLDLDAAVADKTVSEMITKLNHRAKQLEIRAEIDLTNLENAGTEVDKLHVKEARLNEILDVQRTKLQLLKEQYEKASGDKKVGAGIKGKLSNSVLLQELEVSKWEAALRGLSSEAGVSAAAVEAVGVTVGLTVTAIAALAVGLAEMTQYAAKSGQELGRFAEQLNVSAKEAQGLSAALALGGADKEAFSRFITGLDKRIQSVGAAGESAREGLARFGVSLQDEQGNLVGYNEQLKRLAEGYQTAKSAGMTNEYFSALGTGADALRDVLANYEQIEQTRARMGGLFDNKSAEEFVAQSKALDDQLKELDLSIDQIKVSIGAAFLPFLVDIAPKVTEVVNSLSQSFSEMSETIRKRYKNLRYQFGYTRAEYDAAMKEEAERELQAAEEAERKKAEARAKIREKELDAYADRLVKFDDTIQYSLDSALNTDIDNKLAAIDRQAEKYKQELAAMAKEYHAEPDKDSLSLIDQNAQMQKDRAVREFSEQTAAYLDNIYETSLQKRLNQIEREKQAWIQKGLDEVKATEAAEQQKMEAQRNAAMQILKSQREQFKAYQRGGEEGLRRTYMRQNGLSEKDLNIKPEDVEAFQQAQQHMLENLLPYFSPNADFYRALDRDRDARNVIRPAGGDWQPINPNAGEPIPPQFPPEYKSHPIEINVNIENAVTQDNEGMQILANAVADKITPAIESALESDDNAY